MTFWAKSEVATEALIACLSCGVRLSMVTQCPLEGGVLFVQSRNKQGISCLPSRTLTRGSPKHVLLPTGALTRVLELLCQLSFKTPGKMLILKKYTKLCICFFKKIFVFAFIFFLNARTVR